MARNVLSEVPELRLTREQDRLATSQVEFTPTLWEHLGNKMSQKPAITRIEDAGKS